MSLKNLLFKNFSLKVLSIIFAVSLWLFANLKATADRTMKIPVMLDNLPNLLVITNTVSDYVNVKIDGPWRILSNLDPNSFPIHLDLSDAKAGVSNYQISEKMVQIPPGLKVTILFPDTIQIKFEQVVLKDLQVKPSLKGSLSEGLILQEVQVNPKNVELLGAKSEISSLSSVDTDDIDLNGHRESFETEVNVIPREAHVWTPARYRKVKVRVIISEKIIQKEFLRLPVVLKDAPGRTTLQPAHVDVLLEGPASKMERIGPNQVRPEVTVPKGKGPFLKLPVVAVLAEEGVRAKCRPDRIKVTILSKEEPP